MSTMTMRGRLNSFAWRASSAALFAMVGLTAINTNSIAAQVKPARASVARMTVAKTTTAKPTAGPSQNWEMANIANPRVDSWVARFRNSISSTLARGRGYMGMISAKLEARHMPQELVYLPMIESNYNPVARSNASAVGLWQFVASTARHFGLNVGNGADERRDPAKETDAALSYLSQLHDRFQSWYLAAAAYNAGPGTISKALRRVTGRTTGTDEDFYRISPALPAETRDYVPKLIAAARVAKANNGG
jgi:membrane-bound lytic murein transglycosylase D